ncbi:hypothetical protein AB0D49_06130 [Streptomyces sp. NPDC048290]|uniref:hypothetical protein n=1 Tax=Streptomyces sp. NPDC048290 TaxID=3155811 RepID=UPI00343D8E63
MTGDGRPGDARDGDGRDGDARHVVRVTREADGTVTVVPMVVPEAGAVPGAAPAGFDRAPDVTPRVVTEAGAVPEAAPAAESDRAPDFTRSVLDAAGAVVTWSVLGAPRLPTARIHDVGRAQHWLWAVYGERVAAAVHHSAPGTRPGVSVAADPSALAGAAARLGHAHWAARWWPASYPDGIGALEPDVLGLESAALTHRCQQLFDDHDDQPDDCAAELIEEHGGALDPLLHWWRTAPRPSGTARHLDAVLRLIDAAADCAGQDGPALRGLRSALDAGPDPGPWAWTDLATLFAEPSGYALAAGDHSAGGGRVIARGTGTNDWRRYPPGLVDAAEHAVSWTARALGGRRRIEVEVVAHVAAPATGAPLVAEVRADGGPPVRVPLARRDDLWTGRADLDLTAGRTEAPRVDVHVLLPGFDPGPGPTTRADRDAIRALAHHRLTTASAAGSDDTPSGGPGHPGDGGHEGPTGPFLAEILAATAQDY